MRHGREGTPATCRRQTLGCPRAPSASGRACSTWNVREGSPPVFHVEHRRADSASVHVEHSQSAPAAVGTAAAIGGAPVARCPLFRDARCRVDLVAPHRQGSWGPVPARAIESRVLRSPHPSRPRGSTRGPSYDVACADRLALEAGPVLRLIFERGGSVRAGLRRGPRAGWPSMGAPRGLAFDGGPAGRPPCVVHRRRVGAGGRCGRGRGARASLRRGDQRAAGLRLGAGGPAAVGRGRVGAAAFDGDPGAGWPPHDADLRGPADVRR